MIQAGRLYLLLVIAMSRNDKHERLSPIPLRPLHLIPSYLEEPGRQVKLPEEITISLS